MRFFVQLERDTDNSQPGEAELSTFDAGERGEILVVKLDGPEREVWLKVDDLLRVLDRWS